MFSKQSLHQPDTVRPVSLISKATLTNAPVTSASMNIGASKGGDKGGEGTELSKYMACINHGIPEEFLVVADSNEIDNRDKDTPDDWIHRHKDLIRLTGRHPLNCESPLSLLMSQGWVTPTPLHYVRNHGPVPRLDLDAHVVTVDGLVNNPRVFTMRDILSLAITTFPALLVCAGNRRKEQNMIKQTIGFSWGPAGLSNSFWTGVTLLDILAACGGVLTDEDCLQENKPLPAFVNFEGGDKLPKGIYGTSLKIATALDPRSDVLIAFMQNGEKLTPDHGFPIRVVIPGFIGGRMVKWLTRISVAATESESVYHYKDNRVLPTPVTDSDVADSGNWWYKPEYIINELNINSAISSPAHNEVLQVDSNPESLTSGTPYKLRGYAYTGGGRKITRCELSFNGGITWHHANVLPYPSLPRGMAPRHRNSRFWSWFFWELDIPDLVAALRIGNKDGSWQIGCREIALRAWDEGMNTQPAQPTWNLMGMMNNPWFKVRTHLTVTQMEQPVSTISIRFEHPTDITGDGGWMKKGTALTVQDNSHSFESTSTLVQEPPALSPEDLALPVVTLLDVSNHDTVDDVWIAVGGFAYDCTSFLSSHPGGAGSIVLVAGTDCTEEFDAIHSEKAQDMLKNYKVARIATTISIGSAPSGLKTVSDVVVAASSQALHPKQYLPFPLIQRSVLSGDTRLLRFGFEHKYQVSGIQPGQHLMIRIESAEKKPAIRAYTPTSLSKLTQGYFDLLIRVYEGGKVSSALDALQIGDTVLVKGPAGHIVYLGAGLFSVPAIPLPSPGKSSVNVQKSRNWASTASLQSLSKSLLQQASLRDRSPSVADSLDSPSPMNIHQSPSIADSLDFAPSFTFDKKSYSNAVLSVMGSGGAEKSISRWILADRISLIAAGTGITPCWQVVQAIATEWEAYEHEIECGRSSLDTPPKVSMVYANRTFNDILLKEEVSKMAARHSFWFKVTHVLSRESSIVVQSFSSGLKDRYESGRVDESVLRRCLHEPDKEG
ncbi:hypothetical protein BC830DRAFT_1153221 [Chytriomyces sp. MP71]|nr:hypothetical protein BC830DRAFT_1153221 [Chytriomyces sp. MP71]